MIPITEYKSEGQVHKEVIEFRQNPKDFTFMDELEQRVLANIILQNAEVVEKLISEIESGDLDLNNISSNDIRYGIRVRSSCGNKIDKFYSQLNSDYKELVKDAYKDFSTNNLFLVNLLERKLGGE